jgi:iron complex outermembrane recepter protein
VAMLVAASAASAQQPAPAAEVLEEVVITGSQIRGAVISDALPISIIGSETIEFFGIESGDQLLDLIPENGSNFLNEAANISGGVNSARGDVGACAVSVRATRWCCSTAVAW